MSSDSRINSPADILACKNYDGLLALLRGSLQDKSLGQVAARVGYRSKGSLSMLLNGHRNLTRRGFESLSDYFGWNEIQRRHVDTLIKDRLVKTGVLKIKSQRFSKRIVDRQVRLKPEEFSLLAQWYHLPIFLFLSSVRKFPGYAYLEKKFRHKITTQQIMTCTYALEKLGFIKRDGNNVSVNIDPYLNFCPETSHASVRDFHGEMLQRAQESVTEQKMHERCLRALVLNMDPKRVPEAQKVIAEFIDEFNEQFADKDSSEVCQLNMQMFWHTDTNCE